ncbi:MAG: amino acid adenylation domain-containing protein, partial [bacterium]|nr:amino acid adenylation domain-containing protein [bacterium]
PEPEKEKADRHTPPRNSREQLLASLFAQQLSVGREQIGIDDNFFRMGGHSLKATILATKIEKEMQVRLTLQEIFRTSTIRGLSAIIENATREKYTALETTEKKEYYRLSPAQIRIYILQRLEPLNTVYNMPETIPLETKPDGEKLEKVFLQMIERHESLRTTFHMVDEKPVQKVMPEKNIRFKIRYYKSAGQQAQHLQPFDLTRAPLLRVALADLGEGKYNLLVDMHHIITDGMSHRILEQEFRTLYQGGQLPPLARTYKDYAEWQNSPAQKDREKEQAIFWQKIYAGELPELNLPIDYPRPEVQQFDGSRVEFLLDPIVTNQIKKIVEETGVTLYMILLAIYSILLSKLSNREDVIVGTPVAGRRHADLEKIIGMFVNTLAIRTTPSHNKTLNTIIGEIKNHTLQAFENQEYPFEELVEQLAVPRNTGRNPVFDVMFNMLNQWEFNSEATVNTSGKLPENQNEQTYQPEDATAKFDLNLSAVDLGDRIIFNLEYCTTLFKPTTIERVIGYFKRIAAAVTAADLDNVTPARIEMLPGGEKEAILKMSAGSREESETSLTLHRYFEEQVEKTPGKLALVMPVGEASGELTYRELNEKSDSLAALLRASGVQPDDIVGLKVEPSPAMVTAMIAILKAGSAYLPIDPGYPRERIDYMLKDSSARILLVDNKTEETTKNEAKQGNKNENKPKSQHLPLIINIQQIEHKKNHKTTLQHPTFGNHPASGIAYVIYTSGTTGQPKGVMLEHRNLVNLLNYQYNHTTIDFSKVLQFTTISFDVSFQEIFSTLLKGGQLYLIGREIRNAPLEMFRQIKEHEIKTLFLPASYLKFIFSREEYSGHVPTGIKHIVTAGEQVVVTEKLKEYLRKSKVQLHNHYGPSETHVVTALTINPEEEIPELPTIGKPLANTSIFILGTGGQLQPVGVPGELYIGGSQVGRGYLNNPELTAERFCETSWQLAVGSWQKEKAKEPEKVKQSKIPGTALQIKAFGGAGTFSRKGSCTPEGRRRQIYKTGDLAAWQPDGNIRFLERVDSQVKIRGHRVEMGEIENRLAAHPGIAEAVVVTREAKEGGTLLCAYYVTGETGEAETGISAPQIRSYLSQSLPEYMIPSYCFELEKIPLTPNRKIDRRALTQYPITDNQSLTPAHSAPRDKIEGEMVEIWGDILGLPQESIGIDEDFFQMGGHSLRAIIMSARINKEFDVNLTLAEIFKNTTVRTLADTIRERARHNRESYTTIQPSENKDYYVTSSAQKRQYLLQKMEEGSIVYNLPQTIPLPWETDPGRLEEIYNELIRRHESLRTTFHIIDHNSVQRIHPTVPFKIEIIPTTAGEEAGDPFIAAQETFFRPFELAKAPLFRVGLLKLNNTPTAPAAAQGTQPEYRQYLIWDIHHIITDGTSQQILINEFLTLYEGKNLPPLELQYRDYAEWQNSAKQKEIMIRQEKTWLEIFSGELPVLSLPIDYPRPVIQSFQGSNITFTLNKEETGAVKKIASRKGATFYMTILAIYSILLSKLSGQEDIIIGTPTEGRRHAQLEKLVGMFVNTLAMRNYPGGKKTFGEYLDEVKDNTLQAFEN